MILAVTGPMAAGKNLASAILEEKGFLCVDADILVHKVIEDSKSEIVAAFGDMAKERGLELVRQDGSIKRRVIGQLIFGSPELVAKQESIVYPGVNREIDKFLAENPGRDKVINATVLYKVPSINKVEHIIYVDAPLPLRFLRARRRDGLTYKQILSRFKSQAHLFSKYKNSNADIMRVWNTGSREQLEVKLSRILAECRTRG